MSTDADAARAAQHEDDARFWRERALRLGELARPGAFTIPDPRRPDARESSHPADADRRGPGPGPRPLQIIRYLFEIKWKFKWI